MKTLTVLFSAAVILGGCSTGGGKSSGSKKDAAGGDTSAGTTDTGGTTSDTGTADTGGTTGTEDTGTGDTGDTGTADTGTADTGTADTGSEDTGGATTGGAEVEVDEEGCVTWDGASAFCGFKSDGTICEFAEQCATNGDGGNCQIDCEMTTTVACLTKDDVACVEAAVGAEDCAALKECTLWVLY